MFLRCFTVLGLALVGSVANAEEWKMPNLNPFSQTNAEGEGGAWIPGMKKKPATNTGPTMMQRVQQAPSAMMNKTGEVMTKTKQSVSNLNPFKAKPDTSVPWGKTTRSGGPPPKKEGWFGWGGEESQRIKDPQTVSDFIGADRP